jgi:hypothetical protein
LLARRLAGWLLFLLVLLLPAGVMLNASWTAAPGAEELQFICQVSMRVAGRMAWLLACLWPVG